jgi:predicted dinucleotide-binding enzyme
MQHTKVKLAGTLTVIDATNPIADAPPQNGVLKYFLPALTNHSWSVQKIAPDAHFVKAFNSSFGGTQNDIGSL